MAWPKQIKVWDEENPLAMRRDNGMTPQMIMEHINAQNFPTAIYVTDVGQHQMWATQYLDLMRSSQLDYIRRTWNNGIWFSGCNRCKDCKSVIRMLYVTGDGGFQMNIQEMATAVVQGAGVTICLLNNYYLGMVRQMQEFFYGKRYSATCLRKRTGCPE